MGSFCMGIVRHCHLDSSLLCHIAHAVWADSQSVPRVLSALPLLIQYTHQTIQGKQLTLAST